MRPVGIRTISSTCHLSRHPHLVACCIGSLLEGHYARTAERWRRLAGRGSAPLALCSLCPLYPFCKICKDCFAGWQLLLFLRPSGRCVVRNVREKATLLQHHHVRPLVSCFIGRWRLGCLCPASLAATTVAPYYPSCMCCTCNASVHEATCARFVFSCCYDTVGLCVWG